MNPLHLELLANERVASNRRIADRDRWIAAAVRAAAQPKRDDHDPVRRMPRGPRLRTPGVSVTRGLRSLRLLFGQAVA